MEMEERERRVEQRLDPHRQSARALEQPFAPTPEQRQACGKRIEQPPLGDKERQRNAFPIQLGLVIGELAREEQGEPGHAAVEEEPCQGKRAAPAPEHHARGQGAEQADPDQRPQGVRARERQEGVEEIDAEGVVERSRREDRVIRPERCAVGEVADEGEVQREIAQVVGGEKSDLAVLDEDEPAKSPQREESEDRYHAPRHPAPDWRGGEGFAQGAPGQRTRHCAPGQRGPGEQGSQASGDGPGDHGG